MEQPSMLQRSVRHELTVKSSTFSRSGSYFERRTTQAPQPPKYREYTLLSTQESQKQRDLNEILGLGSIVCVTSYKVVFSN